MPGRCDPMRTIERMPLPDDAVAADHALRTVERRAGAVGALAHVSVRRAAELLDVNPSTIQRRRAREAWRPRRALDDHDRATRDAAILTARADGASVRTIAADLGCSVGTVHRVIKAHPSSLALIIRDA
jgi:IS30 family transposase